MAFSYHRLLLSSRHLVLHSCQINMQRILHKHGPIYKKCKHLYSDCHNACMNRPITNFNYTHINLINNRVPSLFNFCIHIVPIVQQRGICSSTPLTGYHHGMGFNEIDEKSGYGKDLSDKEALRAGLKQLKFEIIKWKQEVKDIIAQDPLLVFPGSGSSVKEVAGILTKGFFNVGLSRVQAALTGALDKVWIFDSRNRSPSSTGYWCNALQESSPLNPVTSLNTPPHDVEGSGSVFDGWIVTSDRDHSEGLSTAQLTISPAGYALFHGLINTQAPKDGILHYAGYCNMRSARPRKSFGRLAYYDWREYTHLVIRCRGDGRSYMLNLASAGSFDVSWNDMFHYVLYTRGGPYWQTYKVPFSKFYFASKGTIQDKQCVLDHGRVTSFGITVGDKINAHFRLEIDYIAVECDPTHTEETAYELYDVPKFYST